MYLITKWSDFHVYCICAFVKSSKKIIIWMLLLQEVTDIHSNVLTSHKFDLKLIEKIYYLYTRNSSLGVEKFKHFELMI